MNILYDSVSSDYLYPLSKSDVIRLKRVIPSEDINKIRLIKFGCNTKTTQEGRIVQRGKYYDIRINFCLNKLRSLILSNEKNYIEQIKKFGGKVDLNAGFVIWTLSSAKRYALYLLLHEVGHLIYSEHFSTDKLQGAFSNTEEHWCDRYARGKLQELDE